MIKIEGLEELWRWVLNKEQCICESCCEGTLQAFMALRALAQDNGVSDMSLDDINREMNLARKKFVE